MNIAERRPSLENSVRTALHMDRSLVIRGDDTLHYKIALFIRVKEITLMLYSYENILYFVHYPMSCTNASISAVIKTTPGGWSFRQEIKHQRSH